MMVGGASSSGGGIEVWDTERLERERERILKTEDENSGRSGNIFHDAP